MISDERIYRYLLGDVVIGTMYNSPIPREYRGEDDSPSFGLYERNGKILWKDFGFADANGNTAINLLMYMYHLNYKQAVEHTSLIGLQVGETLLKRDKRSTDLKPQVVKHPLVDFELEYWYRFDLGQDTLIKERIWGLESLSWGGTKTFSSAEDPAFYYDLGKGWKIYWPIKKRFRQWQVDGLVEGFHSLEKRNTGIIFSSTKDRLVGKEAFGCTGINPTSEGSVSSLVKLWTDIKPFASNWFVMYDGDEPGFSAAKKTALLLNIPYIDTRNRLKGNKDLADFVDKQRGKRSYEELNSIFSKDLKL
jgi:hypothetical protein